MEIKELSFLENLSGNDNKTSVMDSVIGGHSYHYSHSYCYDFNSYFSHPLLDKLKDFDLGKITIKVTKPEPEPVSSIAIAANSQAGIPDSPFG